MDPYCMKIITAEATAIVGLAGAVAYLFRSLQKSQEARLEQSREHEGTLEELHRAIAKRRKP